MGRELPDHAPAVATTDDSAASASASVAASASASASASATAAASASASASAPVAASAPAAASAPVAAVGQNTADANGDAAAAAAAAADADAGRKVADADADGDAEGDADGDADGDAEGDGDDLGDWDDGGGPWYDEEDEVEYEEELDADLEDLYRVLFEAIEASDLLGDRKKPKAQLESDLTLARRMFELVEARPRQFVALDERLEWELGSGWLVDLAFDLAEHRRGSEALAWFDEVVARCGGELGDLRPSRIMLLLMMQRKADARALANEALADGGSELLIEPLMELGDLKNAEALARRYFAEEELEVRLFAGSALVEILTETGRKAEARQVEAEVRRLEEQAEREILGGEEPSVMPSGAAPQTGTVVRGAPKVGRNDPCTCGSGKKYKKCCGA